MICCRNGGWEGIFLGKSFWTFCEALEGADVGAAGPWMSCLDGHASPAHLDSKTTSSCRQLWGLQRHLPSESRMIELASIAVHLESDPLRRRPPSEMSVTVQEQLKAISVDFKNHSIAGMHQSADWSSSRLHKIVVWLEIIDGPRSLLDHLCSTG